MKFSGEIRKRIAIAAGVEMEMVKLEHPELESMGDYSSNIALLLKGGIKLAEEIVTKMEVEDLIEKAEVAGPGFINIFIDKKKLLNFLNEIDEDFGKSNLGNGKTAVIDYSAPNIAKPFGIGHLRSTIIGQSILNILKFSGYRVIGDNHLGDWGTQFGKLLYMIDKNPNGEISIDNLEKWYVEFHKMSESNPALDEEARSWFRKLEQGDLVARGRWQKCVDISMNEFNRIYDLLGVKIDYAFGESSYEKLMPEVIAEAKNKEIAKNSQGSLIVEIEGQETPLMLVKSDGATTYATRDLATIKFRKEKWNPEIYVYEVGAEQTLHFKQVFAVAEMLGYVTDANSLIHTKHGMYLAPDGKKFSTREGKTVKLEDVLSEAISRAKKLGSSDEDNSKDVGIGAIKYFDLKHNVQSNIIFDWEKLMSLDGNSGPYLQYTYARTESVLLKSQEPNSNNQINSKLQIENINPNKEELAILRWVYRFPEVVEEAAKRYSPNLVCNYLYELAQRFNSFYNQHSILSADNSELIIYRLKLTKSVNQVLHNGLVLLGIKPLVKM